MKLLVQYGADPSAEKGEHSPQELALEYSNFEIHAFLESKCTELVQCNERKAFWWCVGRQLPTYF